MITPSEFVAQWGEDNLIQNTPEALAGIQLSQASKLFLIEAGLPAHADFGLQFDRFKDEMPTLLEAFPNDYVFPPEYCYYRPIGVDYATIICLSEQDGGRIYSVDIDGHLPTRLMSSDVPHLAEFLLVFRRHEIWAQTTHPSEEKIKLSALELRDELRQRDPEAMRDEQNYWPQVMLDMIYGG